MCSKIFLMNLATEFIPQGAIILDINENSSLIKLRSKEKLIVAVEYVYRNKFYTMILYNHNNWWEIIDVFDILDDSKQNRLVDKNNYDIPYLYYNDKTKENKINISKLKDNNDFVVTSAFGDINGDNIDDMVFIMGTCVNKDNLIFNNIKLVVKYGGTNEEEVISLPVNLIYNPRIRLLSFRTKKYKDIFINMFTLDKKENTYYFVYSYEHGKVRNTFNPENFNETNKFKVSLDANSVFEILSEKTNLIYKLSLSQYNKNLIEEMYHENSKLKKYLPPDALTISLLEHVDPRDVLKIGLYELLVYNRIIGINNREPLGVIEAYLHWDGNEFIPRFQYMINFGKTLEGTL